MLEVGLRPAHLRRTHGAPGIRALAHRAGDVMRAAEGPGRPVPSTIGENVASHPCRLWLPRFCWRGRSRPEPQKVRLRQTYAGNLCAPPLCAAPAVDGDHRRPQADRLPGFKEVAVRSRRARSPRRSRSSFQRRPKIVQGERLRHHRQPVQARTGQAEDQFQPAWERRARRWRWWSSATCNARIARAKPR